MLIVHKLQTWQGRASRIAVLLGVALLLNIANAALATEISGHSGNVGAPNTGKFPGTGEVNVDLYANRQSNPCITTWFGGDALCLDKDWLPGTSEQEHSLDFNSVNTILEFVFNNSGIPWTDYHLGLEGAVFGEVMGAIFEVSNGVVADNPVAMLPHENVIVDGASAWFFFDEPLLSLSAGDNGLVFAFEAMIEYNDPPAATLYQHFSVPLPSTLALFALGVLAMRRKR